MSENIYDIAIIGAGASGMMLAAYLDLKGSRGIILEGSSHVGSKLLMSGGGHCNITHGGSIKDFISAYGDAGPKLRRCLYKHSNLELVSWLDSHGVGLIGEDGDAVDSSLGIRGLEGAGRIFPASMKSRDVLDALVNEAENNGWQIMTNCKVSGLMYLPGESGNEASGKEQWQKMHDGAEWELLITPDVKIRARSVVVSTGGITYPETGSDGSMFGMFKDLGLDVTVPRPALAPVKVVDYPYAELSGISVPDVTALVFKRDTAGKHNMKAAGMKGDLLFTHEGLSGPVILNISRYAEPGDLIRLCYNKEINDLPKRMQRALRDRARGPLGDVRTNVLTSLLDHDDFVTSGVDERGMVTAGGLALDEVDLSNMRVKRDGCSLYVIGEALDADGITGGYNLQLCWSTACIAADSLRETGRCREC